MIKSFDFILAKGAAMPLLNSQYFTLTEIDGLTTVQSSIASIVIPYVDGDTVNSIQAQPRTVTLYLRLKQSAGIEAAKNYIMQYVKPKLAGTLVLQTDEKIIELAGLIESIDLPRFNQGVTMAISIYCSQPYWQDVDFVVQEISEILNLHYFPIEEGGLAFPADGIPFGAYDDDLTQQITNQGDVDTGLIITIIASGAVVNPKIVNAYTGEYIGINDTLAAADAVTITTIKGQKKITKNGQNIIDKIMSGSTFLQLATGTNEFYITADSGMNNVYFMLSYKQRYI